MNAVHAGLRRPPPGVVSGPRQDAQSPCAGSPHLDFFPLSFGSFSYGLSLRSRAPRGVNREAPDGHFFLSGCCGGDHAGCRPDGRDAGRCRDQACLGCLPSQPGPCMQAAAPWVAGRETEAGQSSSLPLSPRIQWAGGAGWGAPFSLEQGGQRAGDRVSSLWIVWARTGSLATWVTCRLPVPSPSGTRAGSSGGSWMLATVGLAPAAVTKLHFSKRAVLAKAAGVGVQSGSLGG